MGPVMKTANGIKSSEEIRTSVNGICEMVANGNVSADGLRETTTDGLQKRMQEVKEDVLAHVNNRINDMMSDVLQRVEAPAANKDEFLFNMDKYRDKKKSDKEGTLPDKEFLARESILTDLFKVPHIRTVYNIFMVTLILLLMSTVANDLKESGTILLGTVTIQKAFAKLPTCLYIWSFMQSLTFGVYIVFNIWAYQRLQFLPGKSQIRKIWDYSWLAVYLVYQIFFIVLPIAAMLREELPVACSIIILFEQVRLVMKSHAFVRSAASRFLSYKPHTEVPRPNGPGFSQFLYFLFAPTLVYRDQYPRTNNIRWRVVFRNLLEVVLVTFYLAFILERFVGPVFCVFGTQTLTPMWYVKNMIEASIPGVLYFLCGNYLLLHAWSNASAEVMQFADRMFYKDWWNCTSYRSYYRTWNVLVHDWLYTYIYKDMYEIVAPRNKTLATFAVFIVSAAVHEYMLAFTFRFFYPVMLVLFGGLGFSLIFAGKVVNGNLVMWLSLCIGNGVMFSLYSMEYYARLNCAPYSNYYVDLFLPRSWSCQQLIAS